ncbi:MULTISPECIES: L,D-transpeptidase [Rhodopseudomonas]|uniref:L,D-transpeptidase n=1 Tax=Rhodopseudomonas TaxID=1073 RepID=UPI000697195D|nr:MULTISPECIES: L,D-transpeptidase [Rhodopseudomonas]MDF3809537.1 L,D-transpeptidase [Rhodopseudomonas sp. BAL398]
MSISTGWYQPLTGSAAFGSNLSICGALLRVGVLTAAGIVGISCSAEAAPSSSLFWPDSDPVYDRQEPVRPVAKRRPTVRHHLDTKREKQAKQAAKPQGPLIVSISIKDQTLKVYDANGLFAETPVSTGMRGHSTPMGVFSVIQKHKYHRSNIYSGAPMPYMQRLTWSGIAMHAGVVPGHPASHGCIRMPRDFAIKMWSWTKMGARVIITPGEIAPESFSHPLLIAKKPVPVPEQPVAAATSNSDDAARAAEMPTGTTPTPAVESAKYELRAGINLIDAKSGSEAGTTAAREPVRTADASPSGSATPVVASDASAATAPATTKPGSITAPTTNTANSTVDIEPTSAATTTPPAAKAEPAAVPKRTGRIAVFISRKDAKIYVRQRLEPLFDAPITIAPGDRPLGTHIFTAQLAKDDTFNWSVVSLPTTARQAAAHDRDRVSRRRKAAGAVETEPAPLPDSATEALDRLTIPPDAMTRIADALSTGGSIIVSDQGIAGGETGEGTDFIVPLH